MSTGQGRSAPRPVWTAAPTPSMTGTPNSRLSAAARSAMPGP